MPQQSAPAVIPSAYRLGGKTAKNLTPRPGLDDVAGLSLTTTPGKGWMFPGGKDQLHALGFETQDVPTGDDPGHFLLRPGTGFIAQGWKLTAWAATRPHLLEADRSTWHELTKILHDAATPAP